MKTKVLAVDVGYGNTKYAYRNDKRIVTDMFPSLAPFKATRTISSSAASSFNERRVVSVTIDGVAYDVGPDVEITAAYGNTGRVLTDDYVDTNNYTALLAGAIHFTGFTHIERLVLGLPVHTMDKFAKQLVERFAGEHDFGFGTIKIDRVAVIPQPLGSLTYAKALQNDAQTGAGPKPANLVVDVGYFTLDWVYVTNFVIDDKRSGGQPGGASQIIQSMADKIGADNGDKVYDIERIDMCLRNGHPFKFFGKDINLAPYLEDAQQLIQAITLTMKNKVGPVEGLSSIILSGGGARLYEPAIRNVFPRTPIDSLENACFANAIGFLLAGEMAATVH